MNFQNHRIRPKKHLGQHFLQDVRIAERIVHAMDIPEDAPLIEVGPGKGILTQFLYHRKNFYAYDVDSESIDFLQKKYPESASKFILKDFLELNPSEIFDGREWHVIGNFPYHLSGNLLEYFFRNRKYIKSVTGMFQKEVAERVCAKPGNKVYGIFSVLLQCYFECKYLFTVKEGSFYPPPKVKSGVIRLERFRTTMDNVDENLFENIVRTVFRQRRKILGNSLQLLVDKEIIMNVPYMNKRPEQMSVNDFIELTNYLGKYVNFK